MNQRTRFSHISNFRRLVVAVVVRHRKKSVEKYAKKSLRLRFCQNPCFEKSLRLRFDENMRILDFHEPQNLKV